MAGIRLERDGAVGRLVLDRPERLNAFTLGTWEELRVLGSRLLADAGGLRALVVTGAGRAFSSGIDTEVLASGALAPERLAGAPAAPGDDPLAARIREGQDSFTWLEDAPFVTIAAIRGYALGAGLQLALACDLRIAARGARLGLPELRYGIMPDLGGTQRLPRLVGAGRAKELILTGRRVDAEEAARLGIVEVLVDDGELDAAAADLAARMAACPPVAVRHVKAAVRAAFDRPRDEGLAVEAAGQAACLRSDDVVEAGRALAEGREPRFTGR